MSFPADQVPLFIAVLDHGSFSAAARQLGRVPSAVSMAIGQSAGHSGGMAIAASTLAIVWNLTFNHLFEQWESRQSVKGRSVLRRVVHALGFEGGLAMVLIPLMAWWFGVTLWEATVMEAGLLVFFLVYTYVFNWCFDHVFGLPASASASAAVAPRAQGEPACSS